MIFFPVGLGQLPVGASQVAAREPDARARPGIFAASATISWRQTLMLADGPICGAGFLRSVLQGALRRGLL